MILKEYLCAAHGDFDAGEAQCPHGCSGNMVARVFRTPPTIQSRGYRKMNATFETLASENGMKNMRNSNGQGMRKADYATHDRLNRATQMIVGAGKSIQGQDAGQYFKPLGAMAGTNTGPGGALQRVNGRMTVGSDVSAIPLRTPQVFAEASFDGRKLGVPQGDAA